MFGDFSTGSQELDALLEELRVGDNVVFYTTDPQDYLPFVSSLCHHVQKCPAGLLYVRSSGFLEELVATLPGAETVDVASLALSSDPLLALETEIRRVGPYVYYLFDPLMSLAPWFGNDGNLGSFFLTLCPLLFQLDSIAYWNLTKGLYSSSTIAAIKDCTQVFLKVDRVDKDLLVTPVKVWGRYSEAMFRPHRVLLDESEIHVETLPIEVEGQRAYTQSLAEKNRELAEIRDALDHSNQELKERNRQLAELNERLSEQSRLYRSLRVNLDHLLELFRAGQHIGSSLVVDQVRQAIVVATLRLFDVSSCRLCLSAGHGAEPLDSVEGMTPEWEVCRRLPDVVKMREDVRRELRVRSMTLAGDPVEASSIAMAPITIRGSWFGTLEVYALDSRLDTDESRALLRYLASEAGIALDNAYLYHETEIQGEQLRSFVEDVITSEEQSSRQLAFDLHDGLIQIIVASYQHLQAAQAWRGRESKAEEQEIEQGVQLLRQAIYEARRLIGRLRPAGLDDFGLVHALRLYVAQLAEDADWRVSLDIDPNWGKLAPALEAALFRIVQEATTNARKYADAHRVRIELRVVQDRLRVSVRDWGRGFDPAIVSATPELGLHMGLIGIRERARHWGGECVIVSQLGEGTSIVVSIPRAHAYATVEDVESD